MNYKHNLYVKHNLQTTKWWEEVIYKLLTLNIYIMYTQIIETIRSKGMAYKEQIANLTNLVATIQAKDAEIASLKAEIETLKANQDTTELQNAVNEL